jgi:hypothetical protein
MIKSGRPIDVYSAKAKLVAFDAPLEQTKTYQERMELLRTSLPKDVAFVQVATLVLCLNKNHMHNFSIQAENGIVSCTDQC